MKNTLYLALFCSVLISSPLHALEPLNDEQLSKKTGQDGLSVSIKNNDGLTDIKSVRIIDGDGFVAGSIDQSQQAGISTNFSSAVRACTTASSTCIPVTDPLSIDIDTDGNGGNAFVNVSIKGAATAFYVPLSSISLVSGTNTKGLWSNNVTIVELKDDDGNDGGIAINLAENKPLVANIQLGSQPQGAMVLVGANVLDIDFGTLNILSYGTNSDDNSQMSTKLSVTDFSFSGIAVDIDGQDGVVMKMPGDTTIGSVNIRGTSFGDVSEDQTVNPTVFNGLKNAPIGNISMTGMTIKNLQVNVKGL